MADKGSVMTHHDVLVSELPETPDAAAPESRGQCCYSTRDELAWLTTLATRHQWGLLANLRAIYARRSWDGPGMNVDGARVALYLDRLLGGGVDSDGKD